VGCAVAALGTHGFAAGAMIAIVGRKAFNKRTVRMVTMSLAACVLVLVVDRLAASLGWKRIGVDLVVYFAVVLSTGALRATELWTLAKAAIRRKNPVPG
jgi:hypothetical protein